MCLLLHKALCTTCTHINIKLAHTACSLQGMPMSLILSNLDQAWELNCTKKFPVHHHCSSSTLSTELCIPPVALLRSLVPYTCICTRYTTWLPCICAAVWYPATYLQVHQANAFSRSGTNCIEFLLWWQSGLSYLVSLPLPRPSAAQPEEKQKQERHRKEHGKPSSHPVIEPVSPTDGYGALKDPSFVK